MCAAAHGWSGLGEIVYAASAAQLTNWLHDIGLDNAPVLPLTINEVAPYVRCTGPFPEFSQRVAQLHQRRHSQPPRWAG